LDQPLIEAIEHLRQWWTDLQLSVFGDNTKLSSKKQSSKEQAYPEASPYAIPSLAKITIPQSNRRDASKKKEKKDVTAERAVLLYRAAIEGIALPFTLLKPILDEFQSALVKKDTEKKRLYPFNLSRFALIKLILVRISRKEGGFMPEVELLANTCDPAYNCGRLLAILQALQLRSRRVGKPKNEKKKTSRPGAGVVERYYGRASTAPAMVFPLLLHLSRHHLAKLQQGDESDKKAAAAIECREAEIMSRLRPDPTIPDAPPEFPRILQLIEQGRFALGFYQQKAYDYQQTTLYMATHGQDGEDIDDEDEESTESEDSSD
jgi:CRISPR-associated protein Csd1